MPEYSSREVVSHFKKNRSLGVSVKGYDPSLSEADVQSVLSEHFASCGNITDVVVFERRALIYFYGLEARHEAVQLDGSNVGGCKLEVKAMPMSEF